MLLESLSQCPQRVFLSALSVPLLHALSVMIYAAEAFMVCQRRICSELQKSLPTNKKGQTCRAKKERTSQRIAEMETQRNYNFLNSCMEGCLPEPGDAKKESATKTLKKSVRDVHVRSRRPSLQLHNTCQCLRFANKFAPGFPIKMATSAVCH